MFETEQLGSLKHDEKVTKTTAKILFKLKERIGKIHIQLQNLEQNCIGVSFQVNSVSAKLKNGKNFKAINEMICNNTLEVSSNIDETPINSMNNSIFNERFKNAVLSSFETINKSDNVIVFPKYEETEDASKLFENVKETHFDNRVISESLETIEGMRSDTTALPNFLETIQDTNHSTEEIPAEPVIDTNEETFTKPVHNPILPVSSEKMEIIKNTLPEESVEKEAASVSGTAVKTDVTEKITKTTFERKDKSVLSNQVPIPNERKKIKETTNKKSIFSSGSDSDDDFKFLISSKTTPNQQKITVTNSISEQATKTIKKKDKKSLFDDSDSDSDLFSYKTNFEKKTFTDSGPNQKYIDKTATIKETKINDDCASKNSLSNPIVAYENHEPTSNLAEWNSLENGDICTILKTRCRGPTNRRKPNRVSRLNIN